MAELLFRRGTQAALKNVTAQDGTFYLTTDTGRLYAGINSKLVELNQSITTVTSIAALNSMPKEKGQFYYVEGTNDGSAENTHQGNILAVWNGTKWVQINPDTDHYLLANTQTTSLSGDTANNRATVTNTIKDTRDGSNGIHTAAGSFVIEGNDNISVTVDGQKIKLAVAPGALYGLDTKTTTSGSKSGVKIDLIKNPGANQETADSVAILAGSFASVAKDGENIVISGVNPAIQGFTATPKTPNAQGTSTGIEFKITDATGLAHTQTVDTEIVLKGVNAGGSDVEESYKVSQFENYEGKYKLPVYTADKVEKRIADEILKSHRALDALTYKGLISNLTSLSAIVNASSLKVSNGDVYKVSGNIPNIDIAAFKEPGGAKITSLKIGDLVIFTGTEDANGYLTVPTAQVVPSGDDQLILGAIDATNNTITVKDNMDITNSTGIKVIGGTAINVSSTKNSTAGIMETTIAHGNVARNGDSSGANINITNDPNRPSGAVTSATVNVVESVTTNAQGHVTGVKTTAVTIADTHNDIHAVNFTADPITDDNNSAKLTIGVSTTDAKTLFKSASVTVNGIGNVAAQVKNGALDVSLVWGEF